jgi:hypothetical protein
MESSLDFIAFKNNMKENEDVSDAFQFLIKVITCLGLERWLK